MKRFFLFFIKSFLDIANKFKKTALALYARTFRFRLKNPLVCAGLFERAILACLRVTGRREIGLALLEPRLLCFTLEIACASDHTSRPGFSTPFLRNGSPFIVQFAALTECAVKRNAYILRFPLF